MAVPIEAVSVVVRVKTIHAKYAGGVDAYRRDCPNATFCTDEHLCRVAFMVLTDANVFVSQLAANGLTPSLNGAAEDVATATRAHGPAQPCGWLEFCEYRGALVAWLAGTPPGDLHTPPGWSFEQDIRHMSEKEAKERLEFIRSERNVDVYRDKTTGEELYVGRTAATPDVARHNDLYTQASSLIEGLLLIDGRAPAELDVDSRRRLERAIGLLEQVVQIKPDNWAAMWHLGKIFQRLGDCGKGLDWFARAHRLNPDQADVAREAAIAAMEVGRPVDAIPYCERAIQLKPNDAGLRANLALALLFSDRPALARTAAEDSLRLNPADRITIHVMKIIEEVLRQRRPCPHHTRDLT